MPYFNFVELLLQLVQPICYNLITSKRKCGVDMDGKKAELKVRLQYALDIREKKAVDLSKDLNIPKSAISQYLSGKSQKMDSKRLYAICNYLNVSEPWLLGFDVPMEKSIEQKNNNIISDVVVRMRTDKDFFDAINIMYTLDNEKFSSIKQMLTLLK